MSSLPASWLLQITYFLPFQEAINVRWEETLQAASRGLPTKEVDVGGEVIPSEGEDDSPPHQNFEEALFSWPSFLRDSGELLPLTVERRQELTVSIIYSYLFKHFHLRFYHITFQMFISN